MKNTDLGIGELFVTSPLETLLSCAFSIFGIVVCMSDVMSDPAMPFWMIVITPFAAFGFAYLYSFLFARIFKIVTCFVGPIIAFVIALAGSMTLLLALPQAFQAEAAQNVIAVLYITLGFVLLFLQINAFIGRENKKR